MALTLRCSGRSSTDRSTGCSALTAVNLRHLAAEAAIAVVTVPARGTSKHCPQCLVPLRHRKAPDRPTTPGWKWALCGSCGWQGDRDRGAWQRIAARGRRTPSPARPAGPAGKHPEGHAPPDRTSLPRAADRHQGVTTISTPTSRHRPRGAALGAGFHLHAHATPPRWADPLPDSTPGTGSLG
ncbi:zinc ribbon domain-containing protein [Streptomyces sp. NPDC059262]|uniref:zinc ribbon domain-containing protein n=1 Tax=Streptomyces sp. NPDC059262 TaxID=3346797 RepID=UPI00368CE011